MQTNQKLGPFLYMSSVISRRPNTVPILSTQTAKYALSGWMSTCSTHFIKYASDVTCVVLGGLGYPTMHFTSAIRSVVVPTALPPCVLQHKTFY